MKTDKQSKSPTKKPSGKVFDVRRPGKAPASPTSRPVIIGHKPEAQNAQTAVSGVGEDRPLLNKRRIEISPFSQAQEAEQPAPKTAIADKLDGKAAAPTTEDKEALATTAMDVLVSGPPELPAQKLLQPPSPEGEKESQPQSPGQSEKTDPTPTATESQEELAPEMTSVPDTETTLPDQPQPKVQPEPVIEPLFNDSGIVVSHHRHHHPHWAVLSLILLVVVLAAAALNLLLDLEILDIETVPHTDLF